MKEEKVKELRKKALDVIKKNNTLQPVLWMSSWALHAMLTRKDLNILPHVILIKYGVYINNLEIVF